MATARDNIPGTRRHMEQMIYDLVRSVRERDILTYEHSRRVAIYANRLARRLGWSRRAARDLALAGLVHDLGKTWIENSVLHKASALSAPEREEMQRHPVVAARILQIYAASQLIVETVLHHHEAYDGHGYPDHLSGENIPLSARILTIADVFDALTSARPYKGAMSQEEARDWIAAHAGTQFDPIIAAAFVALVDSCPDFLIPPAVEALAPLEDPLTWRLDSRWAESGSR